MEDAQMVDKDNRFFTEIAEIWQRTLFRYSSKAVL